MTSSYSQFDFNVDLGAMKQDLTRVGAKPGEKVNSDQSNKYVRFPKGEGVLLARILPADTPKGKKMPYASTRLHYINGRSYHCLRELVDGKWRGNCPICNYYSAVYNKSEEAHTKEESEAIKTLARTYKPIERYYYNVIVRREVDPETGEASTNVGPKILSVGKSLHEKILLAFVGNDKFQIKPLGNVAHPLTGRDLKIIKQISKSGKMEYPNYDASKFEDESVLGSDKQIQQWLKNMWDLDAERNDNLRSLEELQEQIDIIQGKKEDPNLGFKSDDYQLPATFTAPIVSEQPKAVATKVEKPTRSEKKPPKVQEEDVPFNIDVEDMPDDWVKDLQKAINVD